MHDTGTLRCWCSREAHQLDVIISLAFRFSLTPNRNLWYIVSAKPFKYFLFFFFSFFLFSFLSPYAFSLPLYLEKRIGTSDLEKRFQ